MVTRTTANVAGANALSKGPKLRVLRTFPRQKYSTAYATAKTRLNVSNVMAVV
jgi:hypothetical protein